MTAPVAPLAALSLWRNSAGRPRVASQEKERARDKERVSKYVTGTIKDILKIFDQPVSGTKDEQASARAFFRFTKPTRTTFL